VRTYEASAAATSGSVGSRQKAATKCGRVPVPDSDVTSRTTTLRRVDVVTGAIGRRETTPARGC